VADEFVRRASCALLRVWHPWHKLSLLVLLVLLVLRAFVGARARCLVLLGMTWR
jgi:hypothetical protein